MKSAQAHGPTRPSASPLDGFRADRVYLGADHARNERRVWAAAAICALTLVGQLVGGLAFNSMALVAGGVHMAAHVAALGVAGLAYLLARRYAADRRFSFGAGKIGYLAAFANAVALGVTALLLAGESLTRFGGGAATHYHEATQLAVVVLAVNFVCMWLLRPVNARPAPGDDDDVNLRAAHLHLAADVIVSVLAIGGLLAGEHLGWTWADPVATLLIAGYILWMSVTEIRGVIRMLMLGTPPGIAPDAVIDAIEKKFRKRVKKLRRAAQPDETLADTVSRTCPELLSDPLLRMQVAVELEFDVGGPLACLSATHWDDDSLFKGPDLHLPDGCASC